MRDDIECLLSNKVLIWLPVWRVHSQRRQGEMSSKLGKQCRRWKILISQQDFPISHHLLRMDGRCVDAIETERCDEHLQSDIFAGGSFPFTTKLHSCRCLALSMDVQWQCKCRNGNWKLPASLLTEHATLAIWNSNENEHKPETKINVHTHSWKFETFSNSREASRGESDFLRNCTTILQSLSSFKKSLKLFCTETFSTYANYLKRHCNAAREVQRWKKSVRSNLIYGTLQLIFFICTISGSPHTRWQGIKFLLLRAAARVQS